ncbi:FHA domain-containing protein [bacterium]|nr:FHA domain-containing protein [candidate division CSSED10-310 bacterium]
MNPSTGNGLNLDTSLSIRLQMNGRLKLVVDKGKQLGKEFFVENTTVIGNDPAADIMLDDPLVCPRHARIARDGSIWKIWDLKSENGTFINGRLISVVPVLPDCEIHLGSTVLVARYSEPPRIETALVQRSGEWIQLPRIIAHELKNYLQFFDAGIEQIKQDTNVSRRFDGEIRSLEMAGGKMDELVQMLRTGCTEPRLSEMDLVELILEQIALVEGTALLTGIDLKWNLPETPVIITMDAGQIGRSLLNILKNALEACSNGDIIDIKLVLSEFQISLTITDTGHGMDPATLAAMWTPLFTTRPDGNGLGAFIAQTAIMRHKGMIKAESQPGKGTVVTIELPRKKI